MASHPLDFQLQANNYATPELLAFFDERNRMDRWLKVEAALARAQAELGIIPAAAADEIEARAVFASLDKELVRREYERSRNSLIPVLKGLRAACSEDAAQYVHYGSTTQDILDTGQVLEIRETMQVLYRDTRRVEQILLDLSRAHRRTVMIGRTHGQQALPVTFGLKTVNWALELRRHIERLKNLYPRVMYGQLSGAVGTMAALGPRAREVGEKTMARLGLKYSAPGWHTCRDNMAETASFFALLAGTLEKITNEVYLLGKTEVGELAEAAPGTLMSSTMVHKRNPVYCQRVSVLGRHVRSLAGVVVESMVQEHERDPRLLWSEWLAMPQLCMYTGSAVSYLNNILNGLEVRPENMKKNLALHGDTVMAEWLLFRLAPHLGKAAAQRKLHELTGRSPKTDLAAALAADPEIAVILNRDDYEFLDRPERYIGLAVELVDDGLATLVARRNNDNETLTL